MVALRANSGEILGVDLTAEAAIPLTPKLGVNLALGYFDDQYGDGASAWLVRDRILPQNFALVMTTA